LARARELYRNYLKLEPQSSRRAGVERLISELTAKIDEGRVRGEAAPGPAAPVTPLAPPAGAQTAAVAPPPADKAAPPARPAAVLSTAAGNAGTPRASSRKWIIGGTVAAAVIVAAIAIFVVTRSESSFDGPGVNVTPGH